MPDRWPGTALPGSAGPIQLGFLSGREFPCGDSKRSSIEPYRMLFGQGFDFGHLPLRLIKHRVQTRRSLCLRPKNITGMPGFFLIPAGGVSIYDWTTENLALW